MTSFTTNSESAPRPLDGKNIRENSSLPLLRELEQHKNRILESESSWSNLLSSFRKNPGNFKRQNSEHRLSPVNSFERTEPPMRRVKPSLFSPKRLEQPMNGIPRSELESWSKSGSKFLEVPHPGNFKRQDSERRDRLISVNNFERTKFQVRRVVERLPIKSTRSPSLSSSDSAIRNVEDAHYSSLISKSRRLDNPHFPQFSDASELTTPGSVSCSYSSGVSSDMSSSTTHEGPSNDQDDRQFTRELEDKWILNLTLPFRDGSLREKFFISYAETPTQWKRVTVSCDYRHTPPDSLEQSLQVLQYQRDKSARIYESIRSCLPEIQFYDTVTNLRLETDDNDQLHIHVTEDVNESADLLSNRSAEKYEASDPLEAQRDTIRVLNKISKMKRGLSGFVNGSSKSAMADTGSAQNIVSASYVKEMKLPIQGSPSSFRLGNLQKTKSIGTVSILWVFSEKPKETFSTLCHVLPKCTYDLILGSAFLAATETMSKHRRRLTECLFSAANLLRFGAFDDTCQRLKGTLADTRAALAVPDSGAEANVIDMRYAIENGLDIRTGPKHCNFLQFADGSFKETVGQVFTSWTFASGKRIPVTFEVLENCCSDVIIGEEILYHHNVFEHHASSLVTLPSHSESFELAPFDFINSWQRAASGIIDNIKQKKPKASAVDASTAPHVLTSAAHAKERHRRDVWNYRYEFGATASAAELEAEKQRKRKHEETFTPQDRLPVIPSIPTSRSRHTRTSNLTAGLSVGSRL